MTGKRKLLVVDDSELNRAVLSKMLFDQYDVIEAENGLRALEILSDRHSEISLILLDIVMPVMDGFAFLSVHNSNPLISSIPVVVTTKYGDEDNEVEALTAGAADFITKPYRSKVIRHRVSSIISFCENAAMVNRLEYDRLTGVYSKEFFYQYAKQLIDSNPHTDYDIICSDIKNFKLLNDSYGTKICNELLAYVARVLAEVTGDDGFCGRLDADIFAIITKHRDDYDHDFFARINSVINGFSIPSTIVVKYGVFTVKDRKMPIYQICDRTLLALKDVKHKYDKLFAYYNESLLQVLMDEQSIAECMEEALEKKQFLVYIQPKYNIKNGKIFGAEALVRWVHPTKGFLSPAQFIPLFEKNGFIYRLDRYIWEETCRLLSDWISSGLAVVPVSVNVSRYDFYDSSLPEIIFELVKKYRLDPSMLHLEITESAYTDDPEQIIRMVEKMRKLGFVIEMDDFGTGYSSLNMLSQLPIDILKLDMKFIQNEDCRNRGKNILSFVISLARWMNLTVNAEGVETAEQVERLRAMDCNYVQGFFFARPMPCWQFTELLRPDNIDLENPGLVRCEELITSEKSDDETEKGIMLIVDDLILNRSILKSFFTDKFMIAEAANGAVALEYIKEHHKEIDIILLDLVMPVMNGFQLLEKIMEDEDLRDIPVVITSQYGEGNEERTLEMGALDYLTKPYNEKLVVRRVGNALASSAISRASGKKNSVQI